MQNSEILCKAEDSKYICTNFKVKFQSNECRRHPLALNTVQEKNRFHKIYDGQENIMILPNLIQNLAKLRSMILKNSY
jgi:hypothetical protein